MSSPKVILVTGASSGFGAAVVRRFAAHDAATRFILAARREDRLRALEKEIAGAVHLLPLDVRDRAAVERGITGLPAAFADIDLLVNSAGGAFGLEPAQAADLDDWDRMVDTNCKGLMYVTRAVIPGMALRGRGHVINLGSVAGSYPYPGGNVYGATKAFVEQLSLNLRADLAGTGVRVTNIEPGMAETEFSLVRFKGDEPRARAVYQGFPPLTAEDVAEAIFFAATLPAHVKPGVPTRRPRERAARWRAVRASKARRAARAHEREPTRAHERHAVFRGLRRQAHALGGP